MLLCLSNIGDVMANSFRFMYWRICCYKCTQPPKRIPPPIGFHRRTRSFRGMSVRPHHGRFGARSRTTSFRHSQRSGDSAIAMSDGYTRSSYSDTECRYNDEVERDHMMLGSRTFNRESQQSRYSDNITMYNTVPPPLHHQKRHAVPHHPPMGSGDCMVANSPVLFNRYALDREGSKRLHAGRKDEPSYRRPRERLATHVTSYNPPPNVRRMEEGTAVSPKFRRVQRAAIPSKTQKEIMGPSPRILTPLGFAVHRQTYPRPPRESFFDNYMDYYDYYADYMDGYNNTDYTKPVPIWLCMFLVISYIIGGAFLFDKTEPGWGFFNSAYFCFITLTTIGFGDYVPQQKAGADAEIGIAICSLYLLFGIALLAMSFNLVQEEVINNVKTIARHLGIIKDEDEEE